MVITFIEFLLHSKCLMYRISFSSHGNLCDRCWYSSLFKVAETKKLMLVCPVSHSRFPGRIGIQIYEFVYSLQSSCS